jgi:Uma2 family endonuclease
MSALVQPRYTPQQYLERERKAPYKSEYLNGYIYAMAGASREHNQITFSVAGALFPQLRGRPCEGYVTDMRVRASTSEAYVYPDVVVVCGQPRFEDAHVDTLTNPTVIIEVLSPSTEAYDRGAKFAHYRRMDSLQEYVLIAQDRYSIERYVREQDRWVFTEANGLDEAMGLAAIGCELALRDVYDKITLPDRNEGGPGAAPEEAGT